MFTTTTSLLQNATSIISTHCLSKRKIMLKKLAAATIGTVLIFAAGESFPAQAAIIRYDFSNSDRTLIGNFSFDQAAAADDQLVTVAEGLRIYATYGGQTYTEANDSLAAVFTNFLGEVPPGQGLGLQYVVDAFTVNAENLIAANSVQRVAYTANPVPEPSAVLGLSVFGLGLLARKKKQSAK
ncbi:PEP-CTERM sorting domain-containing protein [Nostoc sp. LEGE 06077]|uniref:PEP-CTERM sorting domain-containing protein n=1 Tax=Nostoc sp. LEGE 06077 TaxID=915325 RepID=UPI00187F3670|nr:PEP-CTERM sorting domain-containing protein [Nostoc sp. LEGE 06077]MBE9209237.1 PEP-CTERM sorting domain-containing protein [Nostoc sp. LEGE 06077]